MRKGSLVFFFVLFVFFTESFEVAEDRFANETHTNNRATAEQKPW